MVHGLHNYKTPGTTGLNIVHNTGTKIYEEIHRNDHTIVAFILYFVKHIRPDITNAVRNLSKALY